MKENDLPAHVKIFSTVMTLFGVALISPFGLMFQNWLYNEKKWLLSFSLAFFGASALLLNIIHARWYIEQKDRKNV